eukprot:1384332-Amorphochlora_amoeboformis.AAC.1
MIPKAIPGNPNHNLRPTHHADSLISFTGQGTQTSTSMRMPKTPDAFTKRPIGRAASSLGAEDCVN